MRLLWKSSLFTKFLFYFLLTSSNVSGIRIEYNNIYFIPLNNYELKIVNNRNYIRPDWLLYAINGNPIPGFKKPPFQSIQSLARENDLSVKWNSDSHIISLYRTEAIPPDSSLNDIYALIFYPIQFLKPVPSDLTWTLSSKELNVSYKGKVKVQGVLAKNDGTFSAFGGNIRSPMKLPNECTVASDRTVCRVKLTNDLIYIALRFIS